MGKKLYEETQAGGIRFKSGRKPWEVRTPCYVYDLWLPVVGATTLGVYGLYCRLERQGIVKAITLQDIADACRIGKATLYKINDKLELCQFIAITAPEGWQRLAHFTTEITVLDPPEEVSAEIIVALLPEGREYTPLTPWLVEERPEVLGRTSEGSTQNDDNVLPGTSNVVTLGLEPLDVVLSADAEAEPTDSDMPIPDEDEPGRGYTPGPGRVVQCEDPDTGETVGEPDWRYPQTQFQHQALQSACKRGRFYSKAEYTELERIRTMLEAGEMTENFWAHCKWCAENYRWKLPMLLKYALDGDKMREWEARQ